MWHLFWSWKRNVFQSEFGNKKAVVLWPLDLLWLAPGTFITDWLGQICRGVGRGWSGSRGRGELEEKVPWINWGLAFYRERKSSLHKFFWQCGFTFFTMSQVLNVCLFSTLQPFNILGKIFSQERIHRRDQKMHLCKSSSNVKKTKTDRETKLKRNFPEKSRAGGEQNFGTGEGSRVQRPGTGPRPVGH